MGTGEGRMSATGRGSDNAAQTSQRSQGSMRGSGKTRRGSRGKRRALESAVSERHDIRNERNPLARRHLGPEAHIAPDEIAGRDWTRPLRVEAVTLDVDAAFRLKRGEPR